MLEVWYSYIDAEVFIEDAKTSAAKKRWEQIERNAVFQTSEHIFPKLARVTNKGTRIVDHRPFVCHTWTDELVRKHWIKMFHQYRQSLPDEKRIILNRYCLVDVARKVVGVGSVGTRCAVALLMASEHDPIFLQLKEAFPSVLEPYAGRSRCRNHGERVVTGQRMLQSASDVLLGWTQDSEGRAYYFRQLRDMKMKIDLDSMTKPEWLEYVEICGWALARAHARTGDAAQIAGYLGKTDKFDFAIAQFAGLYADQAESDHAAFKKAFRNGKLKTNAEAA
jgi:uncharacterized protein (DUF2252 family)